MGNSSFLLDEGEERAHGNDALCWCMLAVTPSYGRYRYTLEIRKVLKWTLSKSHSHMTMSMGEFSIYETLGE